MNEQIRPRQESPVIEPLLRYREGDVDMEQLADKIDEIVNHLNRQPWRF